MSYPAPEPDYALRLLDGDLPAEPLFAEASRLRDEGKGRTVTFSKKVFVPLTTLCRDTCTYCTFAKPPGAGGEYLTPENVMAIVAAGESHGCTEALFTLGDQPEKRWEAARDFLADRGHDTTLDYVQAMTERVVAETAVFPHANPGLMSEDAIQYAPDKRAAMVEAARILRRGGRFVFTVYELDPDRAAGLPILGADLVDDYRPLLADAGFRVETYEETPGWPEPMTTTYAALLDAKETLTEEMGEAAAGALVAELSLTLEQRPYRRRVLVVATRE